MSLMRLSISTFAVAALLAPPRNAAAAGERNHVRDVRVSADDGVSDVRIAGTAPAVFIAHSGAGGQIVVDVDNADVVGAPAAITGITGLVGGVLVQSFASGGHATARVIVSASNGVTYRVKREGTTLHVLLYRADHGGVHASTLRDSVHATSAKTDQWSSSRMSTSSACSETR